MSKLLGGLAMPVSAILILLVLGLLLQLLRRRRTGFFFLLLGTAGLAALSLPAVSERLVDSLESQYAPLLAPPPADWIVVLGGGANAADDRPATSRLEESSLIRLTEGLRLARLLPDARVAVSGVGSAPVMAEAAASLGFDFADLALFAEAENTADEARAAAALVGPGETVILVTSAFHMPRAVAQFEAHGLNVIPAPAGQLVDPARADGHIGRQLPRAEYLHHSERAWWEYLGMFWARLTGEL